MHQFLEIIGIIVLSVVAIVVLIVMLRAGFHGPHYDQDKIKTKFNIFHVEKEEQQEALKEKKRNDVNIIFLNPTLFEEFLKKKAT